MVKLFLPNDFAVEIAKSLGLQVKEVEDLFELSEDKQGFFVATLKAKKFLDKAQFKMLCALTRDLGGEGYLQGAKAWKVPSAYAKIGKSSGGSGEQGSKGGIGAHVAQGEPDAQLLGNKQSPPTIPVKNEPASNIQFAFLPVKALLSAPFPSRINPDDPDLAGLTESLKAYGILEPIVVRQKPSGLYEIGMGERRVKAAKKAGLLEVPAIIRVLSDEEMDVYVLIENIHRRDLSDEEKSRALAEFARTKHWNAQQIADHIKMSYPWVCRYLPDEFKDKEMAELGKKGGEAKGEAAAIRRIANQPSEETRQGIPTLAHVVPCAHCGEPVESGNCVTLEGKFYHVDCAEQVKSEKEPGLVPETAAGPFEKEAPKPSEEDIKSKPSSVQIGEFDCTECHKHFFIDHLPNGKHALRLVTEGEH